MRNIPHMKTERLDLRPFSSSDLDDLMAFLCRPEIYQYLNVGSGDKKTISSWFAKRLPSPVPKEVSHFIWAICPQGSFRVIGSIELWCAGVSRNRHVMELGFVLHPSYHRQKVMTEACLRVISFAFQQLLTERIQAIVSEPNRTSQHLLENLGFMREGCLRNWAKTENYQGDAYIYSLLAHEFYE